MYLVPMYRNVVIRNGRLPGIIQSRLETKQLWMLCIMAQTEKATAGIDAPPFAELGKTFMPVTK